MIRKPKAAKVEAFALVAKSGKMVDLKLKEHWLAAPIAGDTTVRLVPFDPDAVRVLRLAVNALREINIAREALKRGHNLTAFATLEDDDILEFEQAVERRQKRGAK